MTQLLALVQESLYLPESSSVPHWKVRPLSHFSGSDMHCKAFNTKNAGKPAGHVRKEDGRRRIFITCNGERFSMYGYHVVWALTKNEWPQHDIDHKDVNPSNDSPTNLRLASPTQNLGNIKLPAHNTSGSKGVGWRKDRACWRATIKIKGKNKHLGSFAEKTDAEAAYMDQLHELVDLKMRNEQAQRLLSGQDA